MLLACYSASFSLNNMMMMSLIRLNRALARVQPSERLRPCFIVPPPIHLGRRRNPTLAWIAKAKAGRLHFVL